MPKEQQPQGHENQEQLPKVKVRGRIGQVTDAELISRKDGSGNVMVHRFSLAVHTSPEETVWYKVTSFEDRAEAMQKRFNSGTLHVGQEVDVAGRLKEENYVSRRAGQPGIDRQIYVFPDGVKPVPPTVKP